MDDSYESIGEKSLSSARDQMDGFVKVKLIFKNFERIKILIVTYFSNHVNHRQNVKNEIRIGERLFRNENLIRNKLGQWVLYIKDSR